ncbi:MAG TPA: transporter substrate-binding domain-containing protein [Candidatus Eisenbacteria bacterium]|nr:transporter substrate-binding domain-containing protein [Candidatus Eisenbacteria bacterium]
MSRTLCALLLLAAAGCSVPSSSPPPLRVGTSGDYPPFSLLADGQYQGLDLDVARAFAADTKRRLEIVEFRWPGLEIDLTAGGFDVAMSGVTMRPWRALVGTFARPVVEAGAVVLVRPDVATNAAHLNLPERRIGVNAGGYLERVARRLFPRAKIEAIPNNLWLPQLFNENKIDAIVSDTIEAPAFRARVSAALVLGPLTRDRKAYLARDPALAADLDAWLRAREADGWLAAERARFLGQQWAAPRTAATSDLDALLAQIDLRLAFMPAVALAKEQLGLPTVAPEQEERVRAQAQERAQLLEVSPAKVDGLFLALIHAAHTIQDAVRTLPPAERPAVEAMDLDEARAALSRVSDQIVARAAELAHDQIPAPQPSADAIANALDPTVTPAPDRLAIAQAVVALIAPE